MITKAEFCTYIKEYEHAMYSVAYSIVGNEHDASDAIGEAIVKAYSKLDSLRNPKAFKSWILRIVHNEAVELIRRNIPSVDLEAAYNLTDSDTESRRAEKLDLREAVKTLPQPYRTVITLYYYEGMPMEDIAHVTISTPLAVRQQISRGRKMLRQMLKEDFLHESL